MSECLGCQRCEDEATPMVTLLSGSIVCSSCPEWLEECEGSHLLNMPLQQRREALTNREKTRGRDGVEKLKALMILLHARKKQNGEQNAAM